MAYGTMRKDTRKIASAFWRRAKEFSAAASLEAEAAGDRVSLPAYYLWGHSIELSLKVFLIGKGITLSELKNRVLGHNLTALWERAKSLGIERQIHLYPADVGVIKVLSEDYADKKFEYAETNEFRLPFTHRTKRTADRLVLLLNPDRKLG